MFFDVAQLLTVADMSDLAPTMNQAENPQIIMMGTPPKPSDPGEVFTQIRKDALAGESEGALYVEFAADPDAPVELNATGAWDQLAKANPSFPDRTSRRAIRRLRKLLTDEDYRREVYGIWDAARRSAVFGEGVWEAGVREARPEGLTLGALGVAVSAGSAEAAIVGAAVDADGTTWLKVLRHGRGKRWVVDEVQGLLAVHGDVPVVMDGRGPGADLERDFERVEIELTVTSTRDVLDACAGFESLVIDRLLRYEVAPELDAAVAGAVKRDVGDRWAWGRKASMADISPLEAGTLAAWAASAPEEPVPVSAYETRGVMTI